MINLKDYSSCGQNDIKSILINIGLSVYIHICTYIIIVRSDDRFLAVRYANVLNFKYRKPDESQTDLFIIHQTRYEIKS